MSVSLAHPRLHLDRRPAQGRCRGAGPTRGRSRRARPCLALGQVAWPVFGLAVVTGIWSILTLPSGQSSEYNVTLGVKLRLSSAPAWPVHQQTSSPAARHRGLGLVSALGAGGRRDVISDPVTGDDGSFAAAGPHGFRLQQYHDHEGRPVVDVRLFEKLCLEVSSPASTARSCASERTFGPPSTASTSVSWRTTTMTCARLLDDAGIVRHQEDPVDINNAKRAVRWSRPKGHSLASLELGTERER